MFKQLIYPNCLEIHFIVGEVPCLRSDPFPRIIKFQINLDFKIEFDFYPKFFHLPYNTFSLTMILFDAKKSLYKNFKIRRFSHSDMIDVF